MIHIGEMRVHLINDSTILTDPGGPFGLVPRALWSPLMPPVDDYFVPMVHHNLVVQTGGKNILIDAGHGTKMSAKAQANARISFPNGGLLGGLERLGLKPSDIDLVIDTHLHADHAGGNTRFDEDGVTLLPTFPNAEYVVQRREYQDAMQPNERTRATYQPMNYQPLYEAGQMRLLDGEGELLTGIYAHVTPGHTPAHMSIELHSNGERLLFVCDLSSYAIHFERLGWMTAYDIEPIVTLETKRRWQQWALDTGALLVFAHDPLRPAGHYLIGENGKASVQKVEWAYA